MLVYAVILLVAGALFFGTGVSIHRGNTGLIHDYHRTNVKESERRDYGRAFAGGMIVLAGSLFLSGATAFFGESKAVFTTSLCILGAGLILSIWIFVRVQKKYNGGLF